MNHEVIPDPENDLTAERFLDNPTELRRTLEARGALDFNPYASGLFPASELSPEMAQATGMGMAWLRDNAHVGNALMENGKHYAAVAVGRSMLKVIENNRDRLDGIVEGVLDPKDPVNRLPVRVDGDTLANDTEKRVQNDSVGYALWCISRLFNKAALRLEPRDLDNVAKMVQYLDTIEYWQDSDEGHWEEDSRIHASSIGVVVAGLRETQEMFVSFGYAPFDRIEYLINKGTETLYSILAKGVTDLGPAEPILENDTPYPDNVRPDESVRQHFEHFSVSRREHDAALLCLVEPLHVLDEEWAAKVVDDIETHLLREKGIARYEGDTYWEPRFPGIFTVEERTSEVGKVDVRNAKAAGIAYNGTEAQWTLFDPLLSVYWGRKYLASGELDAFQKQLFYLNRSLSQLAQMPDGSLKLPEAYYCEYVDDDTDGHVDWIPNDHTPLLQSQANLLSAVRMFETTSRL